MNCIHCIYSYIVQVIRYVLAERSSVRIKAGVSTTRDASAIRATPGMTAAEVCLSVVVVPI